MIAPRPPSASRQVVDGLAVQEQSGDGSTPPVVIVHGGMDRATSFGRIVRLLPDVPIRRYDRRGYGRSEPGTAVDLDRHVADLLTVIGDRPAAVFGHSIGGTIALVTAARHPERISGLLVYESPNPAARPSGPSRTRRLRDLAPEDAAEQFMITMAGERVWRRLPARTRDERRREGPALLADLSIVEDLDGFDLSAVQVPVIVGVGERSGTRRHDEARELSVALPDAELVVVEGAVHGVHLGDPAAAAELIRSLRARCRPG